MDYLNFRLLSITFQLRRRQNPQINQRLVEIGGIINQSTPSINYLFRFYRLSTIESIAPS